MRARAVVSAPAAGQSGERRAWRLPCFSTTRSVLPMAACLLLLSLRVAGVGREESLSCAVLGANAGLAQAVLPSQPPPERARTASLARLKRGAELAGRRAERPEASIRRLHSSCNCPPPWPAVRRGTGVPAPGPRGLHYHHAGFAKRQLLQRRQRTRMSMPSRRPRSDTAGYACSGIPFAFLASPSSASPSFCCRLVHAPCPPTVTVKPSLHQQLFWHVTPLHVFLVDLPVPLLPPPRFSGERRATYPGLKL